MLKIPVIILFMYCTSTIFVRNIFVNGFDTCIVQKSDFVFKQCLNNNNICDVVPFYRNEFREKADDKSVTEINQIRSSEKVSKDLNIKKFQSYFDTWRNYHSIFLPQENAGEKCMKDTAFLISSVKNKDLWALKMIDATAKIPSGLLSGNANQFGDFDECLSIRNPVKAKYFLASLDVSLETLGLSEKVDSLVHAHRWIASNSTDLGHRVPKVSSIYWGICLPSSCSAKDLQITLEDHLQALTQNIYVDEKMTVSIEDIIPYSTGKTLTVFLFGMLTVLIAVVSMSPVEWNPSGETGKFHKILIGFSLRKNFKTLMDTSLKDELKGVDGARALNVLALLLSHKSMALFFNPYVNRTAMAEVMSMPWAIIGRTAIIYTDSFLLISGFLTATAFLRDLRRTGNIHLKHKLVNRVFRIQPTLICIVLFCTYILPDLGSGPLWDMVVTEHSRLCKRNMWRNFFFIHNLMGFETMCLTHTHQLGIDMQLFAFTSIVVGLLWKSVTMGTLGLLVMTALSTGLRFRVTMAKELSMVVYHGMPITKFFDTATLSYILPTHRLTIYLMGVGLAYFMSLERSHLQLNKIQVTMGWILGLTLGLLSMVGPWHMGLRTYKYDKMEAAIYGAFSPISWGLFISWSLWACSNSCAGWFGDFLSWRGFRIFSKIAYGVYLTQFPVFFYNVGRQKYSGYYKLHMMFDVTEIGLILFLSTALALCVEMPFMNMCKVLLGKDDFKVAVQTKDQQNSDNIPECNDKIIDNHSPVSHEGEKNG